MYIFCLSVGHVDVMTMKILQFLLLLLWISVSITNIAGQSQFQSRGELYNVVHYDNKCDQTKIRMYSVISVQ